MTSIWIWEQGPRDKAPATRGPSRRGVLKLLGCAWVAATSLLWASCSRDESVETDPAYQEMVEKYWSRQSPIVKEFYQDEDGLVRRVEDASRANIKTIITQWVSSWLIISWIDWSRRGVRGQVEKWDIIPFDFSSDNTLIAIFDGDRVIPHAKQDKELVKPWENAIKDTYCDADGKLLESAFDLWAHEIVKPWSEQLVLVYWKPRNNEGRAYPDRAWEVIWYTRARHINGRDENGYTATRLGVSPSRDNGTDYFINQDDDYVPIFPWDKLISVSEKEILGILKRNHWQAMETKENPWDPWEELVNEYK